MLAEDEASLYLQATTTATWSPRGTSPVVPLVTNRKKTSFYGSLNLLTGEDIVTREDVINAEATARHLEVVLKTYPDRRILLLWDRAPWHRGEPITRVLTANPRLEIIWLPVAAPDLNPQEHVWKAGRKAVSHNHLTPRLPQLADEFQTHLETNTFPCSLLNNYGYLHLYARFN